MSSRAVQAQPYRHPHSGSSRPSKYLRTTLELQSGRDTALADTHTAALADPQDIHFKTLVELQSGRGTALTDTHKAALADSQLFATWLSSRRSRHSPHRHPHSGTGRPSTHHFFNTLELQAVEAQPSPLPTAALGDPQHLVKTPEFQSGQGVVLVDTHTAAPEERQNQQSIMSSLPAAKTRKQGQRQTPAV